MLADMTLLFSLFGCLLLGTCSSCFTGFGLGLPHVRIAVTLGADYTCLYISLLFV